jgi:hypothetical protein
MKVIIILKVNPGLFIFVKSCLGTEMLHLCGVSHIWLFDRPKYQTLQDNIIRFPFLIIWGVTKLIGCLEMERGFGDEKMKKEKIIERKNREWLNADKMDS